ncbi:hypothetical protein BDA96_07G084900 [Sorghum bicolor]|uniref:BTB domain-containing protein n=2 Tax=Sorghum bicolor TaxID=4558 RepID=A0A1Z5R9R1_SORBI|nr:hypothetical protein BDA96_07G084900 [Sorghum bicolor]OQU80116.1 hypothetical protein SORBI_3007G081200 [Sorghum bicolor]
MAGRTPTSSTRTVATRSTCTPVIQHGSHVFDIMGYSVHKAMGSGLSISSGIFSVGGHDWSIVFFPNNPIYSVDDGGGAVQPCISVYLALMSKGAKVLASCDLGLVDHTTGLPSSFHRTPEPREFRYGDGSMYFPQTTAAAFMDSAQLEASAYLHDDRLTIHCDIAVIKKPSVFTGNTFAGRLEAPPPPNITEHLAKLLETGEGADVTFVVGGETFVAHKFLLAARSPVLRAELCGPMREAATQHVTVDDVQPDHLLVAANRYDVERLKLICQGILCDNLDPGNVATTLALAYHYNCPKLKNLCFQLITDPNTMEAVKATPGYKDLKTNYPCILADALEFKTTTSRSFHQG